MKKLMQPDPSNIHTTLIADHYLRVLKLPNKLRRKYSDSFRRYHRLYDFLVSHSLLNDFYRLAQGPDADVKFSPENLNELMKFTYPDTNEPAKRKFVQLALQRLAGNRSRKPYPSASFK